jgi:hypothetical protein
MGRAQGELARDATLPSANPLAQHPERHPCGSWALDQDAEPAGSVHPDALSGTDGITIAELSFWHAVGREEQTRGVGPAALGQLDQLVGGGAAGSTPRPASSP